MAALPGQCFGHCDLRRLVQRIAIYAAADRRECDRLHAQRFGQLQRLPVAVGEQRRFVALAVVPDRAHRVQYMARRQRMGAGGAHFAGRATHARAQLRQLRALGQQCGPGRAMDRAVDTAATEQCFIGRVDDRIHRQGRDVALPNFDLHASVSCL
jgi:hypothetical protein